MLVVVRGHQEISFRVIKNDQRGKKEKGSFRPEGARSFVISFFDRVVRANS